MKQIITFFITLLFGLLMFGCGKNYVKEYSDKGKVSTEKVIWLEVEKDIQKIIEDDEFQNVAEHILLGQSYSKEFKTKFEVLTFETLIKAPEEKHLQVVEFYNKQGKLPNWKFILNKYLNSKSPQKDGKVMISIFKIMNKIRGGEIRKELVKEFNANFKKFDLVQFDLQTQNLSSLNYHLSNFDSIRIWYDSLAMYNDSLMAVNNIKLVKPYEPNKPSSAPPDYDGSFYIYGAYEGPMQGGGTIIQSGGKYYHVENGQEPRNFFVKYLYGYYEKTGRSITLNIGRNGTPCEVVRVVDEETFRDDQAAYQEKVARFQANLIQLMSEYNDAMKKYKEEYSVYEDIRKDKIQRYNRIKEKLEAISTKLDEFQIIFN